LKKVTKINNLLSKMIREIFLKNLCNDNFIYCQFKSSSVSILHKHALNDECHVSGALIDCAFFHFSSTCFIIKLKHSRIPRKIYFECFRPRTKLPHLRFPTLPRAFFGPTRKQAKFTLRVLAGPRLESLVNLCHGSFEGKEAATKPPQPCLPFSP